MEREGFSKTVQYKMLLSTETRLGIRFTGKQIYSYSNNASLYLCLICSQVPPWSTTIPFHNPWG